MVKCYCTTKYENCNKTIIHNFITLEICINGMKIRFGDTKTHDFGVDTPGTKPTKCDICSDFTVPR